MKTIPQIILYTATPIDIKTIYPKEVDDMRYDAIIKYNDCSILRILYEAVFSKNVRNLEKALELTEKQKSLLQKLFSANDQIIPILSENIGWEG